MQRLTRHVSVIRLTNRRLLQTMLLSTTRVLGMHFCRSQLQVVGSETYHLGEMTP